MSDPLVVRTHRAVPGRNRARGGVLLALVMGLLLVGAPALADPPGPTHYLSTITSVTDAEGQPFDLDLEIVGGDSYFVVRAEPGMTIDVPGYDGEPYVRIEPDGTVRRNERSPARYLNDARYGAMDIDVPQTADSAAPPAWTVEGTAGEYAWHDHRIHFMSPTLPSVVDPSRDAAQHVMDWEVTMVVDGEQVAIAGELDWLPGPSPVFPVGLAVILAAALTALVVRRPSSTMALIAVGVVVTGVVGFALAAALPAGSDDNPALFVLPATAIGAVLLGLLVSRTDPRRGAWLRDAAGFPIGVWGVLLIGALTRPILPPPLPAEVMRIATAVALAIGVAVLVGLARRVARDTRFDPQNAPSGPPSPDDPATAAS